MEEEDDDDEWEGGPGWLEWRSHGLPSLVSLHVPKFGLPQIPLKHLTWHNMACTWHAP
jgi:hypothetical protein